MPAVGICSLGLSLTSITHLNQCIVLGAMARVLSVLHPLSVFAKPQGSPPMSLVFSVVVRCNTCGHTFYCESEWDIEEIESTPYCVNCGSDDTTLLTSKCIISWRMVN